MKKKPISDSELENAMECRLVEPDGTWWEVLDVTVDGGRAWVRARRPEDHDPSSGASENGSNGNSSNGKGAGRPETDRKPRLRIFDTVLTRRARLIWELPGGRRVEARGAEDGDLEWSVERRGIRWKGSAEGADVGAPASGEERGSFFRDAFLRS